MSDCTHCWHAIKILTSNPPWRVSECCKCKETKRELQTHHPHGIDRQEAPCE